MPIRRKLAAVGDPIGKSCAILTYVEDEFYEPQHTIVDKYVTDVEVDGTYVELEIWDLSGHDRFESIRSSLYKGVDVFLIFFSRQVRSSFANVTEKWLPEIKRYSSKVPYVLVDTCIDENFARIVNGTEVDVARVTVEEARELARKIKAVNYVECWAEYKVGIEEIFVTAVKATL